ncbi:hypothetical protein D6789_03465 [Candidatus Woesearchaeota archaeon]|nr:MAG: hypothetical protein D6789_03465 [Candidatus Woesearchaeota archaeon]
MNINRIAGYLERIRKVFTNVTKLIDALETFIVNKNDEKITDYVRKIISYLHTLERVERKESKWEKHIGLKALAKEQERQKRDLELIERAINKLLKKSQQGLPIGEDEELIRKLGEEFLKSLDEEISKLEQLKRPTKL